MPGGRPVRTRLQVAQPSRHSVRWPVPSALAVLDGPRADRTPFNMWLARGHVQLGNDPVTQIAQVLLAGDSVGSAWYMSIPFDDSVVADSPADKRELHIPCLKCRYLFAQIGISFRCFNLEGSSSKRFPS